MFMEESCLTGSSRVKVPLGWRVRVASRVVSTALSAIDSLSPDSRQNRTPTVILTAAALALTEVNYDGTLSGDLSDGTAVLTLKNLPASVLTGSDSNKALC